LRMSELKPFSWILLSILATLFSTFCQLFFSPRLNMPVPGRCLSFQVPFFFFSFFRSGIGCRFPSLQFPPPPPPPSVIAGARYLTLPRPLGIQYVPVTFFFFSPVKAPPLSAEVRTPGASSRRVAACTPLPLPGVHLLSFFTKIAVLPVW